MLEIYYQFVIDFVICNNINNEIFRMKSAVCKSQVSLHYDLAIDAQDIISHEDRRLDVSLKFLRSPISTETCRDNAHLRSMTNQFPI